MRRQSKSVKQFYRELIAPPKHMNIWKLLKKNTQKTKQSSIGKVTIIIYKKMKDESQRNFKWYINVLEAWGVPFNSSACSRVWNTFSGHTSHLPLYRALKSHLARVRTHSHTPTSATRSPASRFLSSSSAHSLSTLSLLRGHSFLIHTHSLLHFSSEQQFLRSNHYEKAKTKNPKPRTQSLS